MLMRSHDCPKHDLSNNRLRLDLECDGEEFCRMYVECWSDDVTDVSGMECWSDDVTDVSGMLE